LYPKWVFLSENFCMAWSRCEVCDRICTMIPDGNFGSKFCWSFISYFINMYLYRTCMIFVYLSVGRKMDISSQHR
jgi:hypothetical protein